MKKNHEKVEVFIRNAIAACGEDVVFGPTKAHLHAALKSLIEVSKKRTRNTATQKSIEKAAQTQKEWWEMLKKNAALNFKLEDLNSKPDENYDN